MKGGDNICRPQLIHFIQAEVNGSLHVSVHAEKEKPKVRCMIYESHVLTYIHAGLYTWVFVCVPNQALPFFVQLAPQSLTQHHSEGNVPVPSHQVSNWLSTLNPLLLRERKRDGDDRGQRATVYFGTNCPLSPLLEHKLQNRAVTHRFRVLQRLIGTHIQQLTILSHSMWFIVWFTRGPV